MVATDTSGKRKQSLRGEEQGNKYYNVIMPFGLYNGKYKKECIRMGIRNSPPTLAMQILYHYIHDPSNYNYLPVSGIYSRHNYC